MQATAATAPPWTKAFRAVVWLALLALALTPFVIDVGARDDGFMTPKWCWIAFWTGLGLIGAVAPALGGRELRLPLEPVWAGTLAWAAWHWMGVLAAPSASLGIERSMHVTWMVLAAVLGFQVLQRRHLRRMAQVLIGVAAITAIWVMIEDFVRAFRPDLVWIQPNLADWRGYLSAGLGNTNHLGDLFALALVPALVMYGEARRLRTKCLLGAALVLIPAALVECFSIGSMIGLFLAAIVMLGLTLARGGGRWFARRKMRWLVLIALWGGIVAFFSTDNTLNPHRPGIFKVAFASQRLAEGGPSRLAIWAEGLEMIRQKPFAGQGTGNFTYVFPTMNSHLLWDRPDLYVYQGMWTNAAHNELLQAWAEMGIGGFFLLILVAALGFHSLLKNLNEAGHAEWLRRMTLAGLLAAICGHAQMNFVLQHPVGLMCFMATLMAISIEKTTRRRPGGMMPPLRWESDWYALRVEWLDMRRPTGLGFALLMPSQIALGVGAALLLVFAAWWGPRRFDPVRSQRLYLLANREEARGKALRQAGADEREIASAEGHAESIFKRALELDPNDTNCRSHYAQWLVDEKRPRGAWKPMDALRELELVRRRLTAREIWLAESRAYDALGNNSESGACALIAKNWHEQNPN